MNLNLRKFPEELARSVKAKAALEGVTLTAFVASVLGKEIGDGSGRKVEGIDRKANVPDMRSSVQENSGRKRQGRGNNAPAVRRSPNRASADTGTVAHGVQEDRSHKESVAERKYLGPKHADDCPCGNCP